MLGRCWILSLEFAGEGGRFAERAHWSLWRFWRTLENFDSEVHLPHEKWARSVGPAHSRPLEGMAA